MNGVSSSSRDNLIIKVIAFFSLVIIAFYLVTEHRAHLIAYSSYIIFGVFILMHLFMHSGHGEHGGCCGGGHDHGKNHHKETEQKGAGQEAGEQQDSGKHEHSQEKLI